MKNGDHLSGTVKKLNNGSLYIDLDYAAGSIAVDWTKVVKIETNEKFQITLDDGERTVGSITKLPSSDAKEQEFVIVAEDGEHRSNLLASSICNHRNQIYGTSSQARLILVSTIQVEICRKEELQQ